jgi:hypothetical protein
LAFGVLATVQSLATSPVSAIAEVLWTFIAPMAALITLRPGCSSRCPRSPPAAVTVAEREARACRGPRWCLEALTRVLTIGQPSFITSSFA